MHIVSTHSRKSVKLRCTGNKTQKLRKFQGLSMSLRAHMCEAYKSKRPMKSQVKVLEHVVCVHVHVHTHVAQSYGK